MITIKCFFLQKNWFQIGIFLADMASLSSNFFDFDKDQNIMKSCSKCQSGSLSLYSIAKNSLFQAIQMIQKWIWKFLADPIYCFRINSKLIMMLKINQVKNKSSLGSIGWFLKRFHLVFLEPSWFPRKEKILL